MHATQYELLLHRRRRRWWWRRGRGGRGWGRRRRLNDRIAEIMTRDSADYRADSRTCYGSRDLPRARSVIAASGFADTEARASADQRAQSGAVNRAPPQLALLRASAQKQRDAGDCRQQKPRNTRSNVHVPSHQAALWG